MAPNKVWRALSRPRCAWHLLVLKRRGRTIQDLSLGAPHIVALAKPEHVRSPLLRDHISKTHQVCRASGPNCPGSSSCVGLGPAAPRPAGLRPARPRHTWAGRGHALTAGPGPHACPGCHLGAPREAWRGHGEFGQTCSKAWRGPLAPSAPTWNTPGTQPGGSSWRKTGRATSSATMGSEEWVARSHPKFWVQKCRCVADTGAISVARQDAAVLLDVRAKSGA